LVVLQDNLGVLKRERGYSMSDKEHGNGIRGVIKELWFWILLSGIAHLIGVYVFIVL